MPELKDVLPLVGVGYSAGGYPKLSSALTNVRNRVGPAILATVGDSTVAGWGAGGAGGGTGSTPAAGGTLLRSQSWPQQMAALFRAAGIPTRADAFFGLGAGLANADIKTSIPQLTLGADWSNYNLLSFGGWSLTESATGTTSLVFAPDFAADAVDITYARLSSFGTFTITDTSGTLATVDTTAGAPGIGDTQTVTVTRNAASRSPFSIQRTTGGALYIVAIRPYARDNPMLEIWNMGWGGATTANWTDSSGNGWKAYSAISALPTQPHLWLNELGFNDVAGGVSAATYQANLQTLVAREKLGGGDVQMINPHVAGAPDTITAAYLAAIATVASSVGLPAIDFNGGITLASADYYDVVHLVASGYAKEAALAASSIVARK